MDGDSPARCLSLCIEEEEDQDVTPKRELKVGKFVVTSTPIPESKAGDGLVEVEASMEGAKVIEGSTIWVKRPELVFSPDEKKPKKVERVVKTVHGTSDVSKRPSLLSLFRTKPKVEAKAAAEAKKLTLMQHFKAAFQTRASQAKDGSAHPHGARYGKYYHTITVPEPRRSNAMGRVMDIFRSRQPSQPIVRNPRRKSNPTIRVRVERKPINYQMGAWLTERSENLMDARATATLFGITRGMPSVIHFLKDVPIDKDDSEILVKFFTYHKCYDLIPTSAKLVTFDCMLLAKKALEALVFNDIRSAPLWDSKAMCFIGMLTITDFIRVLQKSYGAEDFSIENLEGQRLETWKSDPNASLVYVSPDDSVYEAIRILAMNRIHRLPIIDTSSGNLLYILTNRRIMLLLFLYINDIPKPACMNQTLADLRIGTYEDIQTVDDQTTIIDALKKFLEKRVSALPVVDSEGKLKDIVSKFDVINIAADAMFKNLEETYICQKINPTSRFDNIPKCTLNDTLFDIMERMVAADTHRLVVIDKNEWVIGMVSISDLLAYLVLGKDNNSSSEKLSTSPDSDTVVYKKTYSTHL